MKNFFFQKTKKKKTKDGKEKKSSKKKKTDDQPEAESVAPDTSANDASLFMDLDDTSTRDVSISFWCFAC